MAQITLAKALKMKNRLAGRLAKVQADFDLATSCVRDVLVDGAGPSGLRAHLSFVSHSYAPGSVALGLLVACDSIQPFATGVPLDVETWAAQFDAWWVGWREHWADGPPARQDGEPGSLEDVFIPAGQSPPPDLAYRQPAEPPFQLEPTDAPAGLLRPIEDYHAGHHARDWQRMALAYPDFDRTTGERADQLKDQRLGHDFGRWLYVRQVDSWWCEGLRTCVDAGRGRPGEERGNGRDLRASQVRGSVGDRNVVAGLAPVRVRCQAADQATLEGRLVLGGMTAQRKGKTPAWMRFPFACAFSGTASAQSLVPDPKFPASGVSYFAASPAWRDFHGSISGSRSPGNSFQGSAKEDGGEGAWDQGREGVPVEVFAKRFRSNQLCDNRRDGPASRSTTPQEGAGPRAQRADLLLHHQAVSPPAPPSPSRPSAAAYSAVRSYRRNRRRCVGQSRRSRFPNTHSSTSPG